jgi:hypothetical protein
MQHLDLTDEEAADLIKELADITGNDRYPFSARIQTLRAILAKLRPEPAREPLPPPKVYAPPQRGVRADRLMPSPTAATTAEDSWPSTTGVGIGNSPSIKCRSLWHSPAKDGGFHS